MVFGGVIFASCLLLGQSAAPPQFEVASIRLSRNPEPGGNVEITPGRFRGKDLALQWLILTAYKIRSGNLTGNLPGWTINERYSIDAKTDTVISEGQTLEALQALLEDRFRLKMHREVKQEPVYFLMVAKGGVKMPAGTCVSAKKDFPNECWSQGRDGAIRTLDWRGVAMSEASGVAYQSLAWQLSSTVKRPVIDRTGLTGTFDVHLRWAGDPETDGPSIFEALEKQLGLKLESGRGPVEYFVVDHVEKPPAN